MPTFQFDKIERIITVLAPDTEVTVQDLINAIRDWEDNPENMEVAKVADAAGKADLGGGRFTGITLTLLNWKVKFEDRPGPDWVVCSVRGGNLVAVDELGNPMIPIAPAAYITGSWESSVSAALVAEWTQSEKDAVITRTGYIPSDLPDVPTMTELNTAHGAGSWEGATPTQMWEHPTRTLSSRDIEGGEQIASEETLAKETADIKGSTWTDESLKKIVELLEDLARPKARFQV